MRSFIDGQKIKIKKDDKFLDAEIIRSADDFSFNFEILYWVSYYDDGHKEVTVFNEVDLLDWNSGENCGKCTCGSATLKHPGHSYFCDLQ